jgi:hypothetical protein
MKTAQVRSLSEDLLPHMPGYTHKGLMLYASPLNHVIRGFYFEDSGFDPFAFYVWVFFLPLYIPTTHVSFSFGRRLGDGSGERWNMNDPRLREELLGYIQRDGLPFLDVVQDPFQVTTAIQRFGADSDPYSMEATAYSLVMTGDFTAAQEALNTLIKSLDINIHWQSEMRGRATHLSKKLLGNDPQEATQQLAEWEESTRKNLGF